MKNVIVEIARFVIIFLMTVYTLYGFTAFQKKNPKSKKRFYRVQCFLLYTNHFICNLVLYLNTENVKILIFYLAQLAFLIGFSILYPLFYKQIARGILNHMMMLFSISFVMLARISYDSVWRQFKAASVAMAIGLVVPMIVRRFSFLKELTWVYLIMGIGLLLYVEIFGVTVYGAKNWVSVGGTLVQPSEFVKILFVFFAAAGLSKVKSFWEIAFVSAAAAVHVLILAAERDLGAALILFLTYVIMLYIATGKSWYLFGGLLSGSLAAVVSYAYFPHVRVRVTAWLDPWACIDNSGYQIAQSLFAIGTGGWFGMGIGKGLPTSIPVGKSDFIFAAISEEMGAVCALWVMLIYVSCFTLFINISLKMKETFYKLVALGLSVMFIVQVFLSIGGVTKFIPSTGVTLPLVSYGGSSVLSTVIVFGIIQGLYLLYGNEEDKSEKEKRRVKRTNQKQGVPVIKEVDS